MSEKELTPGIQAATDLLGAVLTTDEAATYLKTSSRAIHEAIRLGKLRALRVGRGYCILLKDLEAFCHPPTS
jgi:excisionase family DNA binding protein